MKPLPWSSRAYTQSDSNSTVCRILCVRSPRTFKIDEQLQVFARIARTSKEFQGHGWGCAYLVGGDWRLHHDIQPIWESRLEGFGESTLLVVHARSAFRDEGIRVENNMPFSDGENVFAFNGELQGVRIKERGRIGAEKVFNYIKRFDHGDLLEGLRRGCKVISKRTRYVRAMNIILASRDNVYLACWYGEDPDYFQLHGKSAGNMQWVCSQPYPGENDWKRIANQAVFRL